MKLIQEADSDDAFNKQMMKIQDAIEALETLVKKHEQPIASQVNMLERAARDLTTIATTLQSKRAALKK